MKMKSNWGRIAGISAFVMSTTSSTPGEFADYIKSESARFSRILKEAGAKAD